MFCLFLFGILELNRRPNIGDQNSPSLYSRGINSLSHCLVWLEKGGVSSLNTVLQRASQDKGDYHNRRNGNKHSPIFHPTSTWTNNYLFDDDIRCTVIIPRASEVNEFIVCFLEKTWKKVLTSVSMRNCRVFQVVCLCVLLCVCVRAQAYVWLCVSCCEVCAYWIMNWFLNMSFTLGSCIGGCDEMMVFQNIQVGYLTEKIDLVNGPWTCRGLDQEVVVEVVLGLEGWKSKSHFLHRQS